MTSTLGFSQDASDLPRRYEISIFRSDILLLGPTFIISKVNYQVESDKLSAVEEISLLSRYKSYYCQPPTITLAKNLLSKVTTQDTTTHLDKPEMNTCFRVNLTSRIL